MVLVRPHLDKAHVALAYLLLVLAAGARGSRGSSSGDVHGADLEEACLDEEVPDPARLVHIDLDEVARFAAAELPAAPCVLAHERLLDDEVRLWEDAELRAERLLLGREQVQRRAVRKVERLGCKSGGDGGERGGM